MPIEMDYEVGTGVICNYWAAIAITMRPQAKSCTGTLAVWVDKAAYDAGKKCHCGLDFHFQDQEYDDYFGVEALEAAGVEPEAQVYARVLKKKNPVDFTGGTEVA